MRNIGGRKWPSQSVHREREGKGSEVSLTNGNFEDSYHGKKNKSKPQYLLEPLEF